MKYIGIDLGSSYVKAVLIDLEAGKMVARSNAPTAPREKRGNPNIFEIPAKKMAGAVKGLIDDYTAEYDDVAGVIISTQMHGFVYSVPNREDMYISWQDMRCLDKVPGTNETYLKWLEKIITPEDMVSNGVYLKPSLGFCNLYTWLDEEKDVPRDGTLYTLGSYIISELTGAHVCHITNAAPLGLADVEHHCWNKEILKKLDLEQVKLPRLVDDDYEVCGIYNSNGCAVKVHPDYGDMQIAILGSNIGEGDVVANIATASQVIRFSKDFIPGGYEVRPYFERSCLSVISNMPGGRNLDVLVNFLCECVRDLTGTEIGAQKVWQLVHGTEAVPDEDLSVQTSFYKNPHFPDGGAIRGITQNNLHIPGLFAAAFRDMAETYWHFIKQLGQPTDTIRKIICAGGVSWKTPELCRAIEEVSGKPSCLSPMADEALSGMYKLSLVCSGLCKDLTEAGQRKLEG